MRLRLISLLGVLSISSCSLFFEDRSDARDDVDGGGAGAVDATVGDAGRDAADATVGDAGRDAPDATVSDGASPNVILCDVNDSFGPPELLRDLSTPDHDLGLRLSADGRNAYFTRAPFETDASSAFEGYSYSDLYVSAVTLSGFGPPALLSPPSRSGWTGDLNPTLTADGLFLYFDSYRPDRGVQVATRGDASAAFGEASSATLGDVENFEPYVVPSGSALYFTTGWEVDGGRLLHAWRAPLTDGKAGKPELVRFEGTDDIGQRAPVVSPDEKTIYFTGMYPPAQGPDIYMATRTSVDKPFGVPRPLEGLNSMSWDYPTFITADACELYFASRRPAVGGWDLYRARRPRPPHVVSDASADAPVDVADGAAPDAVSPAPACDAQDLFGAAEAVTELNTPYIEMGIRLSGDGQTAYFSRGPQIVEAGTPGYDFMDLYAAERLPDGSFDQPQILVHPSIPGIYGDRAPAITADGLTLFFETHRTNGSIWWTTRPDAASDFTIGGPVSLLDDGNNYEPYVLPDGRALYFMSDHLPDADAANTLNVWRADIKNGLIDAITLSDISTRDPAADERAPVVSADETKIYYATRTPGGHYRMWMATRPSTDVAFSTFRSLDEISASDFDEYPAYITPDGCELYFASGRSGARDLYRARRPKH